MTVLRGNLDLPDGTAPNPASVRVRLSGAQGRPVLGYRISNGHEVGGEVVLTYANGGIAADGTWQVDLAPTSDISPEGSLFRVHRVLPDGAQYVTFHTVPATGGPYEAYTQEDDPLGTVAPSALSAHAAKRGIGGHVPEGGTNGQLLSRDTNPANPLGTLWVTGSGGGGGGTITSVNGQTGPAVLLNAGHVGADPANTASGLLALFTQLSIVPLEYSDVTNEYSAPAAVATLGLAIGSFRKRWWIGPVLPKNSTGVLSTAWEEGDLYTFTGT